MLVINVIFLKYHNLETLIFSDILDDVPRSLHNYDEWNVCRVRWIPLQRHILALSERVWVFLDTHKLHALREELVSVCILYLTPYLGVNHRSDDLKLSF